MMKPIDCWLVVWNMNFIVRNIIIYIYIIIYYICVVILPIDSYFSRWPDCTTKQTKPWDLGMKSSSSHQLKLRKSPWGMSVSVFGPLPVPCLPDSICFNHRLHGKMNFKLQTGDNQTQCGWKIIQPLIDLFIWSFYSNYVPQ